MPLIDIIEIEYDEPAIWEGVDSSTYEECIDHLAVVKEEIDNYLTDNNPNTLVVDPVLEKEATVVDMERMRRMSSGSELTPQTSLRDRKCPK